MVLAAAHVCGGKASDAARNARRAGNSTVVLAVRDVHLGADSRVIRRADDAADILTAAVYACLVDAVFDGAADGHAAHDAAQAAHGGYAAADVHLDVADGGAVHHEAHHAAYALASVDGYVYVRQRQVSHRRAVYDAEEAIGVVYIGS